MYSCDGIKPNFVSHDPSEIILICWFAAQETFLIIINVKNSCIYLWKHWSNIFYDSL